MRGTTTAQRSKAIKQGKERARKQCSSGTVEGPLIQEELLVPRCGRLGPIICGWFVSHGISLDPPGTIVVLVNNRTLIHAELESGCDSR